MKKALVIAVFELVTQVAAQPSADVFEAISHGDIEFVRRALKNGLNPSYKDRTGGSILFDAIYFKKEPIARLLIEAGADVNCQNGSKAHCIHFATYMKLTFLKYMVEKGADVHVKGGYGGTILEGAVGSGNSECPRNMPYLLQLGIDVNTAGWMKRTPLHIAAFNGQTECADMLLKAGANPHLRDKDNKKPLDYAIQYKHHQLVTILRRAMR